MNHFSLHHLWILCVALWASTAQAAGVGAVSFDILPKESSIHFEVTRDKTPLAGEFTVFNGNIAFHPDHLEKSNATITVAMSSIHMEDQQALEMVKAKDWLDVVGFDKATFQTTSFRHVEGKNYEAAGTLTIKEYKVPVVLAFTLEEFNAGGIAEISGTSTLHRKDFHVGWEDTASVDNEVKITIHVRAKASGAL